MANLNSSPLATSSHFQTSESPMSNMGNLMDAMLVFAVGLLIMVVVRYNVQLGNPGDEESSQDMEQLSGEVQESGTSSDLLEEGNFTELGTVYRDEDTGELYVLTE